MSITEYTPAQESIWTELFVSYFSEDLDMGISESTLRAKLCPFVLGQWEKGILRIALAFSGSTPIGFSVYQIDNPASDWCKFPGWGFIRKFYIAPGYRNKGCGKALASYTEAQLRAMGTGTVYLTADSAVGFWESCGFRNTSKISSNGLEILTK